MDLFTFEKASHVHADENVRQCSKFQKLHTMQRAYLQADNRRAVINQRDVPQMTLAAQL
jgi:hypothetical protein